MWFYSEVNFVIALQTMGKSVTSCTSDSAYSFAFRSSNFCVLLWTLNCKRNFRLPRPPAGHTEIYIHRDPLNEDISLFSFPTHFFYCPGSLDKVVAHANALKSGQHQPNLGHSTTGFSVNAENAAAS